MDIKKNIPVIVREIKIFRRISKMRICGWKKEPPVHGLLSPWNTFTIIDLVLITRIWQIRAALFLLIFSYISLNQNISCKFPRYFLFLRSALIKSLLKRTTKMRFFP